MPCLHLTAGNRYYHKINATVMPKTLVPYKIIIGFSILFVAKIVREA